MNRAPKKNRSSKTKVPQTEPLSIVKTVLRRWGFWAGTLGLLISGGAAAATLWVWEPVFEAKQFIRVIQNREFTDVIEDGRNSTDPKSVLAPLRTELLLSPILLDEDVLNIDPDITMRELKQMVRTEGGGEYFRIVAKHQSRQLAAAVVGKLTKSFVDSRKNDRDAKLNKLKEDLDNEIMHIDRNLKTIHEKLTTKNALLITPKDNMPVDPDGIYFAETLKGLYNEQLEQAQVTQELESWKKSLENVDAEFDESKIMRAVVESPLVFQLDRRLEALTDSRNSQDRLGSSHPTIANLERQIEEAKQLRKNAYAKQMDLQKTSWIEERRASFRAEIVDCENKLLRHSTKIASLETEVKSLSSSVKESNKLEFEIMQILDEQRREKDKRAEWDAKRSRIASKSMSHYQVTIEGPEDVTIPKEPVERYPLKLMGAAGFGGFLIPFVLATLWEFRVQRISSIDQIKNQVSVELVGEVATLPIRSSRPSASTSKRITKQLRLYEESVDNLSAIIAHTSTELPVVFSVTSASSNEGKTTLASQLAISSARSNLGRTLLIDADMRSPSLHRLFNSDLEVGLGDVLAGSVSLDRAIVETDIDNLCLLTAGKLRTTPRRYFSGDDWAELLEEAREKYDHIIVDTPPVLAASESLAISRQCDYSLMCVLRDVSRADTVKRAYDRLLAAEVQVVGCAFGGVPQSEYANKYGSYEYNMS